MDPAMAFIAIMGEKLPCREAPHFGQVVLLAKTVLRWFTHCWFGHCQSPGCVAFLAVPHEGQDACLAKTILVWLMQPVFGHDQSSGMSPPCMPFVASDRWTAPCIMLVMAAADPPNFMGLEYCGAGASSTLAAPHLGQFCLLPNTILV